MSLHHAQCIIHLRQNHRKRVLWFFSTWQTLLWSRAGSFWPLSECALHPPDGEQPSGPALCGGAAAVSWVGTLVHQHLASTCRVLWIRQNRANQASAAGASLEEPTRRKPRGKARNQATGQDPEGREMWLRQEWGRRWGCRLRQQERDQQKASLRVFRGPEACGRAGWEGAARVCGSPLGHGGVSVLAAHQEPLSWCVSSSEGWDPNILAIRLYSGPLSCTGLLTCGCLFQ